MIPDEGLDRAAGESLWILKPYVAGPTAHSLNAYFSLKRICEKFLPGRHRIDVLDILERPELTREAMLIATPTLVRESPGPRRAVIGDLSDEVRVMALLDVLPDARRSDPAEFFGAIKKNREVRC